MSTVFECLHPTVNYIRSKFPRSFRENSPTSLLEQGIGCANITGWDDKLRHNECRCSGVNIMIKRGGLFVFTVISRLTGCETLSPRGLQVVTLCCLD